MNGDIFAGIAKGQYIPIKKPPTNRGLEIVTNMKTKTKGMEKVSIVRSKGQMKREYLSEAIKISHKIERLELERGRLSDETNIAWANLSAEKIAQEIEGLEQSERELNNKYQQQLNELPF